MLREPIFSIHDIHHTKKLDSPSGTALSWQDWLSKKASITSERVGDVVGVREKSKSLQVVTASLNSDHNVTEWLLWDSSAMSGEVKAEPTKINGTEESKKISSG